eukprot:gene6660-10825_t
MSEVAQKIIAGPSIEPELQQIVIDERQKYREKSDFGENGLFAFCCQNYVSILDPKSIQIVNTLSGHKTNTTAVSWCPLMSNTGIERGNTSILASGDENGVIIIWDMKAGKPVYYIDSQTKSGIIKFTWINNELKYLLVLFANSTLCLFDLTKQSKMWSKTFQEPLISISLNPFDESMLVTSSKSGNIYIVLDFNFENAPQKIDHKFKVGEVKDAYTGQYVPNLKDVVFSPFERNQLYLVTKREVAIYDLILKQTISDKSFHGAKSDFHQIFLNPNLPRNMFSLHEDGKATFWSLSEDYKNIDHATTDTARGNKHGGERPGLLHTARFKDDTVVAVGADGKAWIWRLYEKDWILEGLLESISSAITAMDVSPFSPLVAVGTQNGNLQISNMVHSGLEYKHEVFSQSPLMFVRWFANDRLITATSKSLGKNHFENQLTIVTLASGKHIELRKDRKQETTFIKAIEVSTNKQIAAVLLHNRPLEIWDLRTCNLLRLISMVDCCAINFRRQLQSKWDPLFVITSDGTLYTYSTEKVDNIVEKSKHKAFPQYQQISCADWKNDLLCAGDASGNLISIDFLSKKSKTLPTPGGPIESIKFARDQKLVLVLYQSGSCSIYELDQMTKIANSPGHIKGNSIDWAAGNFPVITTKSGTVHIFDLTLQTSNSSVLLRSLREPLKSPATLPKNEAAYLKSIIYEEVISVKTSDTLDSSKRNEFGELIDEEQSLDYDQQMRRHFDLLNDDLVKLLSNEKTIISERCLEISKYFSDEVGIKFWNLASVYLEKFRPQEKKEIKEEKIESTIEIIHSTSPIIEETKYGDFPLIYDLLRDDVNVREQEIEKLKVMDSTIRRNKSKDSTDLFSSIAQSQVLSNRKEDAVQLLLQTPSTHPDLYKNYLHACAIAATTSPQNFRQTMDFVAGSLIILKTEEEVNLGVELLCIINQGDKACRILQEYGQWEKAARIAKCILPLEDRKEVLLRWANHLTITDKKMEAVGMYMSLGLFNDVLNLLNQSKLYDIAVMFIKACEINNIPMKSKENTDDQKFINLKSQIFFAYATHLESLGNKSLSEKYHNLLSKFSNSPISSPSNEGTHVELNEVEATKPLVEIEVEETTPVIKEEEEASNFSLE